MLVTLKAVHTYSIIASFMHYNVSGNYALVSNVSLPVGGIGAASAGLVGVGGLAILTAVLALGILIVFVVENFSRSHK